MRKSTKLAILVAALVALCSFAAFATSGWVQEGDQWYYNDSNGEHVYTCWKQSGNNYYYLGDEGYMLKDQLIVDGTHSYYVGPDGARIVNAWQKVTADDTDTALGVDYRWYYFGANARAVTNTTKTLNGKKYRFDSDGKMLFGFADANYAMLSDIDDPVCSAKYYYGTNEDGALLTGWQEIFVEDKSSNKWFYFATNNGAKYGFDNAVIKKINGKKYYFEATTGIMQTGWVNTNSGVDEALAWQYYDSNGALIKNAWVHDVPDEDMGDRTSIQSESGCATDYADDTERYFYTDYNGNLVHDQAKKINGKYYTFDEQGVMKYGLVGLNIIKEVKGTPVMTDTRWIRNLGSCTGTEIIEDKDGEMPPYIAYFSTSDDGSLKTGTVQIELADDTYTFYFNKQGFAVNGVSSKKLYARGILRKADSDIKYTRIENVSETTGEYDEYLVNTNGTVFTSNTVVRDGDENYIAIYKATAAGTFEGESYKANDILYIKIAAGDKASTAANYFRTNGSLGTYESDVNVIETQVFEVQ